MSRGYLHSTGKNMLGYNSILIYKQSQGNYDIVRKKKRDFIIKVDDLIVESIDTENGGFFIVEKHFMSDPIIVKMDITEFANKIKSSSTCLLYELFCFTNHTNIPNDSREYLIKNANYKKIKMEIHDDFKLKEDSFAEETFKKMKENDIPLVVIINFFAAFDIFINAGIACTSPYDTHKGNIKCLQTNAAMENLLCEFNPNIHKQFTGEFMKFIQPSYRSIKSFNSMYDSIKNKPLLIPIRFFMMYNGNSVFPDETKFEIILAPKYFYSVKFNLDDSIGEQTKEIENLYNYEHDFLGISYGTFTVQSTFHDKINCHFYSCFFDYKTETKPLIEKIIKCKCHNKTNMIISVIEAFNLKPTAINHLSFKGIESIVTDFSGINANIYNYELFISLLRLPGGYKLIGKINDKEKFKEYLDNNEGGFDFFRDCILSIKSKLNIIDKSNLEIMRDAAHEFAIEKIVEEKYFKAETTKEYILLLQTLIDN